MRIENKIVITSHVSEENIYIFSTTIFKFKSLYLVLMLNYNTLIMWIFFSLLFLYVFFLFHICVQYVVYEVEERERERLYFKLLTTMKSCVIY
jgi:hypothetical protein